MLTIHRKSLSIREKIVSLRSLNSSCNVFRTNFSQYSLTPVKFFLIFLLSAIFSKSTFSKNSFKNTIRMSNSLDPDQARHFVGPDLGPNCLQKLSADNTRR